MKKKTVLIIAAIAAVGIAAYIALAVVPVYPLYEKEVDTYEELSEIMERRHGIAMPAKGNLPFTPTRCLILRDSTALLSKPLGYAAYGSEDYSGTTIYYAMSISGPLAEDMLWRPVECSKLDYHPVEGPGRMVDVTFSFDKYNCELYATYLTEGVAPEQMDAYLEEKLMDSANLILRQTGTWNYDYLVLPPELTQWSEEMENGVSHGPAGIMRGETMYLLTQEEYHLIVDEGADPDEVLAARWEWYEATT